MILMDANNFIVASSRIHGRGLFARRPLAARRKLGELSGERITQSEGRRRVSALKCVALVELGDGHAIDASAGGNYFRYINHSCAPNCFMRVCRGRVEFYSLRRIKAGEELTCHYGETHHGGGLACRCRSALCQEYI
jgi:SET domain-containing protein